MRNKRTVRIGDRVIGGNEPVLIQSMTNTDTADVDATVSQILSLEEAGCEIIRVAAYDVRSACAIEGIKERIHIPLVADVHFDADIAIAAIEHGADKVRINPGNIGSEANVMLPPPPAPPADNAPAALQVRRHRSWSKAPHRVP